jgi:hypothetical protein
VQHERTNVVSDLFWWTENIIQDQSLFSDHQLSLLADINVSTGISDLNENEEADLLALFQTTLPSSASNCPKPAGFHANLEFAFEFGLDVTPDHSLGGNTLVPYLTSTQQYNGGLLPDASIPTLDCDSSGMKSLLFCSAPSENLRQELQETDKKILPELPTTECPYCLGSYKGQTLRYVYCTPAMVR